MPQLTEISDGAADPNTPTVAAMQESQRAGSVGKGTSTKTFAEKNALRNQGTGLGEGSDEQFPEASDITYADNDSGY